MPYLAPKESSGRLSVLDQSIEDAGPWIDIDRLTTEDGCALDLETDIYYRRSVKPAANSSKYSTQVSRQPTQFNKDENLTNCTYLPSMSLKR